MNLRKMMHTPIPKYIPKVHLINGTMLIWHGHVYDIIEDENGDCDSCAADHDRIDHVLFNHGMCPDNDTTFDWTCYQRGDGRNYTLRHRR